MAIRNDADQRILGDVVSAHLRSLEPDQLKRRHTVKPWFNGKLDARLTPLSPVAVAVEATGGFETVVAASLATAGKAAVVSGCGGLPVVVVNPKLVAIIAVARKLLTILNAVLRDKRPWRLVDEEHAHAKPRSDGKPRSAPVGRVKAASRESARLDAAGRCRHHFHQQSTLDSQASR